MKLTLSNEETQTLKALLRDTLPGLKREAAATNLAAREIKSELGKRVTLCERLISELEAPVASSQPA